jgi:hypothetical protein
MASVALVMLPACSSSDESSSDAPTEESTGGGNCEDCGVYTGDIDIAECEVRNSMRDGC